MMIEDHYQVFEEFFLFVYFGIIVDGDSSVGIVNIFFLNNDNNKKRDEKNKSRRILFVSGSFKSFLFVCLVLMKTQF